MSPLDENVNNLKLKASSANDKEDGSYNLKAVQQDGTIDDNDALRKLLDIDRIFDLSIVDQFSQNIGLLPQILVTTHHK